MATKSGKTVKLEKHKEDTANLRKHAFQKIMSYLESEKRSMVYLSIYTMP